MSSLVWLTRKQRGLTRHSHAATLLPEHIRICVRRVAVAPITRRIRLFLSWSHRDAALKDTFVALFTPHAKLLDIEFDWWEDSHLFAGDAVNAPGGGIPLKIDEADYGLCLLSANYLTSSYIVQHELPQFMAAPPGVEALGPPPNRFIPIALRPFGQFEKDRNLHGIKDTWVFYDEGRAYSELSGTSAREGFAMRAVEELRRRIARDNRTESDGWRRL
jgi:hypothetical protein